MEVLGGSWRPFSDLLVDLLRPWAIIYKFGFRAGLTPADLLMSRFVVATPLLFAWLALTDRDRLRCSPATIGRAALVAGLFYAPQTASFAESLRLSRRPSPR